MSKDHTKNNLPAMPFYVGDWFKCMEVRALPPDYRGLWFDMICFMWESTERGVMVNPKGLPYSDADIVRMVGLDNQNSGFWLTRLLEDGVCARREDGAIYCKRMVKDEKIRLLRKEIGAKGGNPSLLVNHKVKMKDKLNTEYESEYENECESENVKPVKTSLQAEFISKFGKKYTESTGQSFKADKKHYVIVSRLIKEYGLQEVQVKAGVLLSLCKVGEVWYVKNGMADFTIENLSGHWNKLIPQKKMSESEIKEIKFKQALDNERRKSEQFETLHVGFTDK